MSTNFDSLRTEINECFYEIVGVLEEVIKHRTDTFANMLEAGEGIQEGSESFVEETDRIVGVISGEINRKIDNLNMDQMKKDILEATDTFIEITEELELLSYNTICRTMALGDKGATITHISKEIKKYSTTVKALLDIISGNFNEMFKRFKEVADHLMEDQLVPDLEYTQAEKLDDFVITSDVSVLIENSQFHDIFMQELEIINEAVSKTSYKTPYEAGLIFGVYEKATAKLDFIKYSLQEKLEVIKGVMGDFIYTFNTDLQNIGGKTNILRTELSRVNDISGIICSNIKSLNENIAQTKGILQSTKNSVTSLAKQSKTFRNLVVITAVEVARINDESLRSVVVSMNQTEDELNRLIEKLNDNIDMWADLRGEFVDAFTAAENEMDILCDVNAAEGREAILRSSQELDEQLDSFRHIFMSDKYVNFFDSSTERLMSLFAEFNESIQQFFMDFNDKLGDDILSDEEFTRGRNEAEMKDILAGEDEQSSVEFF